MPNRNYVRNKPAWGFDRLRSDALSRLLDDLHRAGHGGITPSQCDLVKGILSEIVNIATEFPDRLPLRNSIYKVLEDFEEKYSQWNAIEGVSDEHQKERFRKLKQLREIRHKLSSVVRKNQHIIEENLDLTLIDAVYDSIGGATKAAPDVFTNLAKAAARYAERRIIP